MNVNALDFLVPKIKDYLYFLPCFYTYSVPDLEKDYDKPISTIEKKEFEGSSNIVHEGQENKRLLSAEEIFNNYNNNKYKINQISKDRRSEKSKLNKNSELDNKIPNKIQEHNMIHLHNKTEGIIKTLKENHQDSQKNKSLLPILEEIVAKLYRWHVNSKFNK